MPDRSRHLTARSSPVALPHRRRVRSPPTPSPPPPVGETNYYRSKKRSRTRSVTLKRPALGLAANRAGIAGAARSWYQERSHGDSSRHGDGGHAGEVDAPRAPQPERDPARPHGVGH